MLDARVAAGSSSAPAPRMKRATGAVIRKVGAVGKACIRLSNWNLWSPASGQLLLILASRDVQSVADLALASGRARRHRPLLGRLVDQGFLVVGD